VVSVRVFVSYARKDQTIIDALVSDLDRLGHEVWYDLELRGGETWWNEILRQVRVCDVLIFAASQRSSRSQACRSEAEYAATLNRPILPVQIDADVSTRLLPPCISERQFVQYLRRDADANIALVGALSAIKSDLPLPDPLPKPPPVPISYLVSLSEAIDSLELGPDRQRSIIAELQARLESVTDDDERSDVVDLMRRLRNRADVLASVAADIDRVLASPSHAAEDPDLDGPRDSSDVMAHEVGSLGKRPKEEPAASTPPIPVRSSAQTAAAAAPPVVFDKVWYLPTRPEGKARELVERRTGRLEIGPDAATFTSKSLTVALGDIQQVELITVKSINIWVHVIYVDHGDAVSAYFADARSLGYRGILGGTKRICAALKALEH
jgi:hypothetical protein